MASNAIKVLVLTVALGGLFGYLFAEEEYGLQQKLAQIEKSPGYAPAVYEDTNIVQHKKTTKYRAVYRYAVAGRQYRVSTKWTDREGLLKYTGNPEPKVAYSKDEPAVAVDMGYFMMAHPSTTGTVLLALFAALVSALCISWQAGWLSRATPAAPARRAR